MIGDWGLIDCWFVIDDFFDHFFRDWDWQSVDDWRLIVRWSIDVYHSDGDNDANDVASCDGANDNINDDTDAGISDGANDNVIDDYWLRWIIDFWYM